MDQHVVDGVVDLEVVLEAQTRLHVPDKNGCHIQIAELVGDLESKNGHKGDIALRNCEGVEHIDEADTVRNGDTIQTTDSWKIATGTYRW